MSLTLIQWLLIGVLLIVIGLRQPRGAMMIAVGAVSLCLLLGFQDGALPSFGDLERRWAAIAGSAAAGEPRAVETPQRHWPRTSSSDRAAEVGKTSRLPQATEENNEPGKHGLPGRPQIDGREAFRDAVIDVLDDFAGDAGSELRGIIAQIHSIRELTQDGGKVLAFVETPGCRISVYPRGWRTSRVTRARVIAHEAYHCWLDGRGRIYESENHLGFEAFERRVAAELYGSRAAHADFYP